MKTIDSMGEEESGLLLEEQYHWYLVQFSSDAAAMLTTVGTKLDCSVAVAIRVAGNIAASAFAFVSVFVGHEDVFVP